MSLSNGIVPDELKVTKVVPIYKKENLGIFGNYRPVSVLPCISKILERNMYNRSYDCPKMNNCIKNSISYKSFDIHGCC